MGKQGTEEKNSRAKINDGNLTDVLNKLSEKIIQDVKEETGKYVYDKSVDVELDNIIDLVTELEKEIAEYEYKVEITENLDIDDVTSKSKFKINITNSDGCFVEIDLFKYRDIMLTYGESEEAFIEEQLKKISGIGVKNLEDISKLICDYISYVCYFKELQTKIYSEIGWCKYNNQWIFKYDEILYNSNIDKMIRSRSINSISDDICVKKINEENEENEENENGILELNNVFLWIKEFVKVWDYDASVLDNSKKKKPYNSLILAAACTGLIRQLLPYTKESNINMNIVGKRASGKSTICHFALSLFGNPEALEGSFIDSDESAEIIRAKRPIIPYILDERMLKIENESDRNKRMKILIGIFREYEGKVKERMAGKDSDISGVRTYAPVISSSVESMMDILLQSERDLGQYRRFIELNIEPEDLFMDGETAQIVEDTAYSRYGYGVQLIIQFILDNEFCDVKLKELYDGVVEKINIVLEEREKIERNAGHSSVIGLKSSTLRFALIITTAIIIEEAIKTFIKNNIMLIYDKENAKKILNGDYLNNHKEILDILVDNLVDKMKRINVKLDVYDNIKKFIANHPNLFAKTKTEYGQKSEDFFGYKEEIEDGSGINVYVRKGRGLEWLMASEDTRSDEEIMNYVKRVQSTKKETEISEIITNELGSAANRSLLSALKSKDKDRVKVEHIANYTNLHSATIITLLDNQIDGEELKDTEQIDKKAGKKASTSKAKTPTSKAKTSTEEEPKA